MGKLQRKTTQQENRKEEENRKGENCKGGTAREPIPAAEKQKKRNCLIR